MIPPAGDYVFVSGDPNISGTFTNYQPGSFSSDLFSRVFLNEPAPYRTLSWSSATDVVQPGNQNNAQRFVTANAPDSQGRSYYAQLVWNPDPSIFNAVFRVDSVIADAVYSPPPTVSFVLASSGPGAGFTPSCTPIWDKKLPNASCFTVLSDFNNEAVRDNETGLVWEKSPSSTTVTWPEACLGCYNKVIGGRKGWRLPSFAELSSLVDPSTTPPYLSPGHPFVIVLSTFNWSATTMAENSNAAWVTNFNSDNGSRLKTESGHVWYVRGPIQEAVY
jgi:hypothetical protein